MENGTVQSQPRSGAVRDDDDVDVGQPRVTTAHTSLALPLRLRLWSCVRCRACGREGCSARRERAKEFVSN